MSRLLLDTSAYSTLFRGDEGAKEASAMQHGLELLTDDAHYARVRQIVVRPLGTAS